MSSGPDLFVVCKSCGSEVSPYITECPYCGTRLRKRAPKLERGGVPKAEKAKRTRPRLGRLRPGEIPGIRGDRRPYITITLVLAAVIVTLGARAGLWDVSRLILGGPLGDEYWRTVTTLFVYTKTGYEVAALGAILLFGWLLERRHGSWAPLIVFFAGGLAGTWLVVALDPGALALGGNGPALALLAAWTVRDVLGRRRGREDDADLLGVLAIATLLVLLPVAAAEAHPLAGLGGGLVGLALGLLLARIPER